ncbi:MAG: hypothetical protein ACP8RL_04085 [cyanobacterium endosymbiont of Rhopalodia inflata]
MSFSVFIQAPLIRSYPQFSLLMTGDGLSWELSNETLMHL